MTVTNEVSVELARQVGLWGEQNHPDGTGGPGTASEAEYWRAACDDAEARGELTWRDILTEEFFEALAESDVVSLRTELIQVAAVALQWVQAIDRRYA